MPPLHSPLRFFHPARIASARRSLSYGTFGSLGFFRLSAAFWRLSSRFARKMGSFHAAAVAMPSFRFTGKMFDLTDSLGRKLFESFAITLVCDECLKTEHPERCTHKLHEMPRWLSSTKMETVKSLLAVCAALLTHTTIAKPPPSFTGRPRHAHA